MNHAFGQNQKKLTDFGTRTFKIHANTNSFPLFCKFPLPMLLITVFVLFWPLPFATHPSSPIPFYYNPLKCFPTVVGGGAFCCVQRINGDGMVHSSHSAVDHGIGHRIIMHESGIGPRVKKRHSSSRRTGDGIISAEDKNSTPPPSIHLL